MKFPFACVISLLVPVVITARLTVRNEGANDNQNIDFDGERAYQQQDDYSNNGNAYDIALIRKEFNIEEEADHGRGLKKNKTTKAKKSSKDIGTDTSNDSATSKPQKDIATNTSNDPKKSSKDIGTKSSKDNDSGKENGIKSSKYVKGKYGKGGKSVGNSSKGKKSKKKKRKSKGVSSKSANLTKTTAPSQFPTESIITTNNALTIDVVKVIVEVTQENPLTTEDLLTIEKDILTAAVLAAREGRRRKLLFSETFLVDGKPVTLSAVAIITECDPPIQNVQCLEVVFKSDSFIKSDPLIKTMEQAIINAVLDGSLASDKGYDIKLVSIPSAVPSFVPSSIPSQKPSLSPSDTPSAFPSSVPTGMPSEVPSSEPSTLPSAVPSFVPSSIPSQKPSLSPSDTPSAFPSSVPTGIPSEVPSSEPSTLPSAVPSFVPSSIPSQKPSLSPSDVPSSVPSSVPTGMPSEVPSSEPSTLPSAVPSFVPSSIPSQKPSLSPSDTPSAFPSSVPTGIPSEVPSSEPSTLPSAVPSFVPSSIPSQKPSLSPSDVPSSVPSSVPTGMPSEVPSSEPSTLPSAVPSFVPSSIPSQKPSLSPSDTPSAFPSSVPTGIPSEVPSSEPSTLPSAVPSFVPSSIPSQKPSLSPSDVPSSVPSSVPTGMPSEIPSSEPSTLPSAVPSFVPSSIPSQKPSLSPSDTPSAVPSESKPPSVIPSVVPSESAVPSFSPSSIPSQSKLPSDIPSAVPIASAVPSFSPSSIPSTASPTTSGCGSESVRQEDYRGTIAKTVSGRVCQRWDAQYPHAHSDNAQKYPEADLENNNYCRNPNNSIYSLKAWCYTTDPYVRKERCAVPSCPTLGCGSVSVKQTDYRGTIANTVSGRVCQRWDAQSPHVHSDNAEKYPNADLENNNFCRNPDAPDSHEAWCYTTDPEVRKERCAVPYCSPTLGCGSDSVKQTDYRGTIARTVSGRVCQSWDAQSPHGHSRYAHNYPNAGLENNNNCRNPDGSSEAWCYTTDPEVRFERCDVPSCSTGCGSESVKQKDYDGTLAKTVSGRVCQRWDAQSPHGHGINYDRNNYCKNPNAPNSHEAWCYTTDPKVRFERCAVSYCPTLGCGSESVKQIDYRGTIAKTVSGRVCQRWDAQYPHAHSDNAQKYPNADLENNNYCRNPNAHDSHEAWCYTTDPNKRFERCSVPYCTPIQV